MGKLGSATATSEDVIAITILAHVVFASDSVSGDCGAEFSNGLSLCTIDVAYLDDFENGFDGVKLNCHGLLQ
jgi:hypothetical protein